MRKVITWFRSHPLTTAFLAIVALGVAMHLFANWRAEVRWRRYCEAARARGVKLTLVEFAPPEIPDAENFAALPMFKAIFNGGVQRPMELPKTGGDQPGFGNPIKGERIDWKAWQKFFKDAGYITETTDSPPSDVLRALEHYAPQFKEWSEWKTRTRCRFPLDYKAGVAMRFPHLGAFQDAVKLFGLRMRAHLALDDSAAAYLDFREGLQAYFALREEPALISGLVQLNVVAMLISAVGDGLGDHAWKVPELERIDANLAEMHPWDDYRRAFASERAFGNWVYEYVLPMSPWQRAKTVSQIGFPSSPDAWVTTLIPTRVYRDNQIRHNEYIDELLGKISSDGMQFDPDAAIPDAPQNLAGFDEYYFFMFRISAIQFTEIDNRFAFVKTQIDQTRIAIALERFRIAHGAFPETLAELVPDFIAELPQDIYTRRPMIYRRKDEGSFLLYSVGPDRHDDGGVIDPKKQERKQLDWVWPYAGK